MPKIEDAEALPRDRPPLADPGDRRHPLQREPRAEGDRGRRRRRADQPRQHRRARQGRRRRARREEGGHPDADRRQLRLAAEAPRRPRAAGPGRGARRGRARGGAAAREARLPRLQDLGQVEPRADDDPRLPDARRAVPYPLHLGVTEAGTPFSGSIKSAVGMGALLVDGIGDTIRVSLTADPVEEVEDRVGDPQGARPARARPGDDRLPDLRPRQRRRPDARRGGRGAARRVPAALRGRGARLRRERAGRGGRRRLRHRRRPRRRLHLRARPRAEEGRVRHPHRRALQRDRPVDRATACSARSG